MRLFSTLWSIFALLFAYAAGTTEVNGATAYVPLRDSVATGTYYSPNYLSVVKSAVGRESAYQMFSKVIEEHYRHSVDRFGKDEVLVRALQRQRGERARVLGLYAEERFVEMNRDAGWQKVNNRFASQRDVWRRVDGRVEYAQIKVHGLGRSATTMRELAAVYLESMREDSGRGQARWFLVPDDHLDAIKELIDKKHSEAVRRGDDAEAAWLLKQRERLAPLGVDYDTLSHEADLAQQVGRARIVAKYAGPAISAMFLVGSTAYETFRWSSGQSSGAEYVMRMGKTGSFTAIGFGTSWLIAKSEFLMANPYRTGGFTTAASFLVEMGWLIYEHGGLSNALSSPEFFVQLGANLGAATLGLIGGIEGGKLGLALGATIGTWFGPLGTAPGAVIGGVLGGAVGGAVGGIAGYLGGAALTEWMLETFAPELYYKMKLEEIEKAEAKFRREIDRLSDLSCPLFPGALPQ